MKYVCMILLKWKGKHRLGLLADGWAALWGGRRYGFEPCQTAEEIDTLPQFNNTLECPLKTAYWECLSCRTDALRGATCSLTPWMSKLNPSGLTVNAEVPSERIYKGTLLKTSLQPSVSTQPHMCLGASRQRGALFCTMCAAKMFDLRYLWSPAVLHPNIFLSVNMHT